jgi:hypothetical protein
MQEAAASVHRCTMYEDRGKEGRGEGGGGQR